jgi:BolA protein
VTETRAARIEGRLREAFSPDALLVKDQSHLHAGHTGAKDGRGHFEIQIVADAFADKGRLESHRMIYEALGSMMTSDIHALSIRASAKSGNLSE